MPESSFVAARTPSFHQIATTALPQARDEIAHGLLVAAAQVSPKYFYDRLGSSLFEAITLLDEYYPTRTEAQIMAAHAGAIAAALGTGGTLVDLGAGNCEKAGRLFATLQPQRYVAVDIAADFVRDALGRLQRLHPTLEMHAVGVDFAQTFELPPTLREGRATLFYPGSSIGNFAPDEAVAFLRRTRSACPGARLLIGVDLVKDRAVLEAAYDDALGVTAAFNLNLLRHLNRQLGSDFDLRDWQHVAWFDEHASRIEMHLQARRDVTVRWPGAERAFAAGQRIHTENSYKYRRADFEALLRDGGYARIESWTDAREWFAVYAAG